MKRLGIGTLALLVLVAALALTRGPQDAQAQDQKPKGQLQGMILDSEGDPAWGENIGVIGLFVNGEQIYPSYGGGWFVTDKGGFYRIPGLKPGVYEVLFNPPAKHRPLRLLGVVVKAGSPTRLDVKYKPGTMMEVIGDPVTDIPPAIVVSEELKRLQKQIDDLKKQLAALKK